MQEEQEVPGLSYEKLLFICCSLTLACYFSSYMRMPLIPIYARQLGADTVLVGIINGSFLFMAGLLSLPLGMLSDRLGRKRLILSGLFLLACSSLLLSQTHSPFQMVWINLLMGIGLAAFGPTMMSYVADISPLSHLGRTYGWYTLSIYTGMSLGPAAGGFLADWIGFAPVFVASGVLALILMLITWFVLPRARHVVLRKPTRRPLGVEARELARNWPLLACWFVTFGGCVGLGMFITYIPLHARDQGLAVAQVGLIFTVQGLLNALSRIPFGRLSDRVPDRSHPVVAGLVCFAFSIASFGIASNLISFMIPAALVGLSMAIAFTAIGALISEVVKPESRGLAMGGYNTAIYFGMMLGSMMMGPIIREIGFKHGFFLVGLLNLITTMLFFVVFYHARRRPKVETPGAAMESREPETANPEPKNRN